jgi:iron complex outermembrane recepter protein
MICVAACLGLLPHAGVTQDSNTPKGNPLKQLTLEQLGNVEVTSVKKEPEQVWDTPAAISVLTNEDIRRSGVTNILDALRLVPGVDMSRNDSIGYSVGIRGFETVFSKGLLVMIDGRSLYNTLFGGVYQDLPDYPLEDIDRIEVIRGPGATVWGRKRREWRHQHHYKTEQRYPGLISLCGRRQCGSIQEHGPLRRHARFNDVPGL